MTYLVLDDHALLRQCEMDTYRSHGPGGQKRNKTSSAVRLRHSPTGLAVIATEDRSQHVNKARALRRLRAAIALHVRSDLDPVLYTPSELFHECVAPNGEWLIGRRDPRRYLVVSELLDLLAASSMQVSEAAKRLDMSTGQFVKLLDAEPKLRARVNEMRQAAGLKALSR